MSGEILDEPWRYQRTLIALTLCALLLCAHLLYLYLCDSERFPIAKIKIMATYDHISHKQWEAALQPYSGESFFSFPSSKLQKDLEKLDWTDTAQVERVWPDALKITLVEKIPVAIVGDALLTESGERFNAGVDRQAYSLPQLTAPLAFEKQVLQVFQKLSKILVSYGLHATAFEQRENGASVLTLSGGIKLNLGKKDLDLRVTRFCKAYSTVFEGMAAEKLERLVGVDLRYPRGMAVQWKNKREDNG